MLFYYQNKTKLIPNIQRFRLSLLLPIKSYAQQKSKPNYMYLTLNKQILPCSTSHLEFSLIIIQYHFSKKKISFVGLLQLNYSDYSFQNNTVQHLADHNMLDKIIQKLGHQISNSFHLYPTPSLKFLYIHKLSFQKSMLLIVLKAVLFEKEDQKHLLEQESHIG